MLEESQQEGGNRAGTSAERRKVATVLEKHEEMLPSTKRNFAADHKLGKCRDSRWMDTLQIKEKINSL